MQLDILSGGQVHTQKSDRTPRAGVFESRHKSVQGWQTGKSRNKPLKKVDGSLVLVVNSSVKATVVLAQESHQIQSVKVRPHGLASRHEELSCVHDVVKLEGCQRIAPKGRQRGQGFCDGDTVLVPNPITHVRTDVRNSQLTQARLGLMEIQNSV